MRSFFAWILILSCFPRICAWALAASSPLGSELQTATSPPPASESSPSVRPEAVNVFVGADERLFILMAALNLAGYDYASGSGDLSPLRKQLRNDLAIMEPTLRGRLADYYKVHRRASVDGPPRIGGYVGLSLALSVPPALSLQTRRLGLPDDVVGAADFAPLVREFYAQSDAPKLFRSAIQQYKSEVEAARQQVGAVIFQTLNYLHTIPIVTLVGRGGPENKDSGRDQRQRLTIGTRTRRLFVLLNPLDAADAAYVRNDILNGADTETDRLPGDDYFVVLGSSSNVDPVRLAFLRFVLEPLGERFAVAIREHAKAIGQLAEKIVGADAAQKETAFSIVNESLVRAVEARMKRLRAQSALEEKLAAEKLTGEKLVAEKRAAEKLADDEAMYDLSTHYEQGAVLAFHFYEKLIPWEQVGADIAAYYEDMVGSIHVEREAARATAYREVRARVETRRAERQKLVTNAPPIVEPLRQADVLIQERQFEPAQTLLRDIVKQHPNNARALYGLAQAVSQIASQIDPAKSADPDAAWEQLMTQLEQAVQLYRQAIAAASAQEEKWLISQAHVAIGKILDFAGQREAAVVEYQKAIEVGDVPGGAYAQAKARLEK